MFENLPDERLTRLATQILADKNAEAKEWSNAEAAGYGDMEEWPPLVAVYDRQLQAVDDMISTPAITLGGILAKMVGLSWCQSGNLHTAEDIAMPGIPTTNLVLMTSIIKDLAAMQPALWIGDAR